MTKCISRILICFILVCGSFIVNAQRITIRGKITDASTNEPVAYATVGIRGAGIATTSNFDGLFKLELERKNDSVTVSSVGYHIRSFFITKAPDQTLNIQLQPSSNALMEVKISPKGYVNPAWEILREIIIHKPQNDPQRISSYQYESYNRIELDATHLSESLRKKKFINKALSIADSLKISGTDNLPVLPLFLSENSSDFYYRRNPQSKREDIKKTKTNGIGFEDGTLIAQLTGSTFQQYNFYKNFVSAAGKDFISPIADGWKDFYEYQLEDRNAVIDGKTCYQISFTPKRSHDLAFTGTIWVAQGNYALYRIKATIEPAADLNFINKIAIQQQMEGHITDRPWLPVKTRILVEVDQLSKNSSGLLAKFYTVNKNIAVNKSYPDDFFKQGFAILPDAGKPDDHYWDKTRPDSLTKAEKSVFNLIDTVKNIPTVKNYLTVADILINGYYRAGKVSFGPFLQTYSYNTVEGNRIRLGFKTNPSFDNRWILGGYAAYGTKDGAFKYGATADYILDRKHWTEAGASFTHDLNQVALMSENYLFQRNNLFSAFTRYGRVDKRKVFKQNLSSLYIKRDLFKGFTEKINLSNGSLDPLFPFRFKDANDDNGHRLVISEVQFESRWDPGAQPLASETFNKPVNLKTDITLPVFTFRYTMGLKNIFGGDLNYHKFSLNVTQTLKMGRFGRGKYSFSAGYIPSRVPYLLLENHLGNETFLYNPTAFNLMRFFEFASDKYASVNYTQHFQGFLLNSIPLIRDLKWRLVGTANILYGGMSAANQHDIQEFNKVSLRPLGRDPYLEAGYGIENIFKFIRIDFIHRLTYRDSYTYPKDPVKNFGIKASAQIRL